MKKISCFIALWMASSAMWPLNAQEGAAEEESAVFHMEKRVGDCPGAVALGSRLGPVVSNNFYGHQMEIRNQKKDNPYLIAFEKNVVWYKIECENSGLLTFTIQPVNPAENYDFVLYKSAGRWFCPHFQDYVNNPLRSNLSATPGVTGLAVESEQEFVTETEAQVFSSAVEVQAGEVYYVVVNAQHKISEGHFIERSIQ